jgi:ribonucleoside-diphosphate reductase alpha chain
MGLIDDSIEGIFEALKEGAVTMQHGGGDGYDFSTLRPRGSRARSSGTIASGPVSFMRVWDAMCATILSTGARRGAMMATLRCDHPDIEEFVDAKRTPDELRHFNLSVQVTDAFMDAVKRDAEWPLAFRGEPGPGHGQSCRTLRARELWERICSSAYDCADRCAVHRSINATNNLANASS